MRASRVHPEKSRAEEVARRRPHEEPRRARLPAEPPSPHSPSVESGSSFLKPSGTRLYDSRSSPNVTHQLTVSKAESVSASHSRSSLPNIQRTPQGRLRHSFLPDQIIRKLSTERKADRHSRQGSAPRLLSFFRCSQLWDPGQVRGRAIADIPTAAPLSSSHDIGDLPTLFTILCRILRATSSSSREGQSIPHAPRRRPLRPAGSQSKAAWSVGRSSQDEIP